MTVPARVIAVAVFVASLSTLQTQAAFAQSFYERITAVARTEVTPRPASEIKPHPSKIKTYGTGIVPLPPKKQAVKKSGRPSIDTSKRQQTAAAPIEKVGSWSHSEIQLARARCRHMLSEIDAEFVAMEPIRKGACGDPAPVRLLSVGSKPRVSISPAVVVNCDMAVALHNWVSRDLQPLARKHLKSPIVAVESMSSYSCRNAYGRKNARLSQHARANAIDIRGFTTAKKAKTQLLSHWGPTQRAIRAAQKAKQRAAEKKRLAKSRAAAKKKLAAAARGKREAGGNGPNANAVAGQVAGEPAQEIEAAAAGVRPSILEGLTEMVGANTGIAANNKGIGFGLAPSRLGGPAFAKAGAALASEELEQTPSWPVYLVSKTASKAHTRTPSARFLRAAHRTACGLFGTVLGPEANNAHRNHFHVDLAQRKLGPYCR
ncbi:MAG: extensin family protein [Alphaproteobacteria bacterium]|nr:extensin family protein [Alphaproteobacteria bacterium]